MTETYEFLRWIFGSFWRWLGFFLLVVSVAACVAEMLGATLLRVRRGDR